MIGYKGKKLKKKYTHWPVTCKGPDLTHFNKDKWKGIDLTYRFSSITYQCQSRNVEIMGCRVCLSKGIEKHSQNSIHQISAMNALIMILTFLVSKVRTDSPNWGDREASQKSNWGGDTNYLWKNRKGCRERVCETIQKLRAHGK